MNNTPSKNKSWMLILGFIVLMFIAGYLFRFVGDNMSRTVYLVVMTILITLGYQLIKRLNSKSIEYWVLLVFLLVGFIELISVFLTVTPKFYDSF